MIWTNLWLGLALADPISVPVQGQLLDPAGAWAEGTRSATLVLYAGETEVDRWTRTIAFAAGHFYVELPIEGDDLTDGDLSLGISVGGAAEARAPIGWAPRAAFARRAEQAARVGDIDAANVLHTGTPFPWPDLDFSLAPDHIQDGYAAGDGLALSGTTLAIDRNVQFPWTQLDLALAPARVRDGYAAGDGVTIDGDTISLDRNTAVPWTQLDLALAPARIRDGYTPGDGITITGNSISLNRGTAIPWSQLDLATAPSRIQTGYAAGAGLTLTGTTFALGGATGSGVTLKIGDSTACSTNEAGTLRYHNGAFEGCNGTTWTSIGVGSSSSPSGGGVPAPAYAAVFGTCGAAGKNGPTQPMCDTQYASQGLSVSVTGGIQTWTVPATGTYVITAFGAQGGESSTSFAGGRGAIVKGEFFLTQGQQLKILVGQAGGANDTHGNENGGGGGTFVVKASDNSPLIIAGGGGGAPSTGYGGSCGRTNGDGQSGPNGKTVICNGTGAGGTAGGGGGNNPGVSHHGGGGGGLSGNGADGGNHCGVVTGGRSFLNGGQGGSGAGTCYPARSIPDGGFGGGGAGQLGSPGGGGGYSGGGSSGEWSSYSDYGGGGGSYNIGTNGAFMGASQNGHGAVIIASAGPTVSVPTYDKTLTTCGKTGRAGPSQSQCDAAYAGLGLNITVSGGIQTWTVPTTGTWRITAAGAQGATTSNSSRGGFGASVSGDAYLTAGEQLKILVGQVGLGNNTHGNETGGGGGTYVVRPGNRPIVVAGGGGGGPSTGYGTSCTRTNGEGQLGTSGRTQRCAVGVGWGGSNGLGGGNNPGVGHHAGAGGGFWSGGENGGNHCGLVYGGDSFSAGGAGGSASGTCYPGAGFADGGFGGGGAGQLGGPGGGGGWSGGGTASEWSSYSDWGGGGGSIVMAGNPQFLGATNTGGGWVRIQNVP